MNLLTRFENSFEVDPDNGCWMWTGSLSRSTAARPVFFIAGRRFIAARLAIELYREEVPGDLCACHRCDNPMCVNPDHLWLGTHAENMADARRKGRMHCGEASGNAKLTEKDVREIHALYATGSYRQADLARRFGVGHSIIAGITAGERWMHLGMPALTIKHSRGLRGDENPSRIHPERCVRGERHPRCRLTDEQVAELRKKRKTMSLVALAESFGISPTQAGRIANGESRMPPGENVKPSPNRRQVTPQEIARVFSMGAAGKTRIQIATAIGIPLARIDYIRRCKKHA